MNLVDFLNINSQQTFSESKAFGEDDEIPSGNLDEEGNEEPMEEEPMEEEPTDDGGDDTYEDSQGDSNMEMENPEDNVNDVNDSNILLNTKLSTSFVTLYQNQKEELEKLRSSNLESSEFGAEFKVLIDEYQTTLEILYDYKTKKFETESTAGRMEMWIKYKSIFNSLSTQINNLLIKMNDVELE
mgnify:CR=1 FL=1